MAYTFDAGPNAVLFLEHSEIDCFASIFFKKFASSTDGKFFQGRVPVNISEPDSAFESLFSGDSMAGQVQYVISCRIGEGPKAI